MNLEGRAAKAENLRLFEQAWGVFRGRSIDDDEDTPPSPSRVGKVVGHLFDGLDEAAADRPDAMRSDSAEILDVSDSRPIGVAEVIPLNVK